MGAIGESRQHAAPARREAEGKVAATNGHRTRGSASLPGTSPRKQRPPPIRFCETNPPILEGKTGVIVLRYNGLCGKNLSRNGGFVFGNEPTGRVFFEGKRGKLGAFGMEIGGRDGPAWTLWTDMDLHGRYTDEHGPCTDATERVPPYDGARRTYPPRFYQTKPVVMLTKMQLCDSERMSCIHYRKMTTGFVFREMGGRGGRVWTMGTDMDLHGRAHGPYTDDAGGRDGARPSNIQVVMI